MTSVLSMIYKAGTKVKNWSYDYHLLDQVEVSCPVISIGNLSMGGTGKTPVTQKIYEHLSQRYARMAIISRNYKAMIRSLAPVDPQHPNGALFYGDEPAWLAAHCPRAQVFVGPRKYETAAFADEKFRPDLMLIDDGFQHRALQRDCDLVLWDATAVDANLFPSGRLREDFSSLRRADYILLTKVNWAGKDQLEHWRHQLRGLPVVEVEFKMDLSMDWIERSRPFPVAAFAGIAHPILFRAQLENALQRELDPFWSFPDHYDYPMSSLQAMEAWLKKNPESYLFTTEKDAIKLKPWVQQMARVIPVPLSVKWGQGKDEFLSHLDHVHR